MKVVQLHEWAPKQFLNPTPTRKKPLGPQKIKNNSKIESTSNVKIEKNKENESCSTTWVDPKSVIEHFPNQKIAG